MNSLARWWLDSEAERVLLRSDDQQNLDVTGLDIWSAEYEGLEVVAGAQCARPSSDLPNVVFEVDFLQLELYLIISSNQRSRLQLRAANVPKHPVVKDWPVHSQIVVGDHWLAVDSARTNRVRDRLAEQRITLGEPLSEAQLLWLLWQSDLELRHEEDDVPGAHTEGAAPPDGHGPATALVDATLYPYQNEGVQKLIALAEQGLGCLLADEMGLGKTIQIIALMSWLKSTGEGVSLVIAPSSTLANWCRELGRFAPHLSVHEHSGSRRSGDPTFLDGFDIVITSFDLATRDQYLLQSIQWRSIAVDEAQNLKNPQAQRSEAIRRLKTRVLLAITGTPIENSLVDLWAIMSLVAPRYLSSLREFNTLYPDEESAAAELGRRVAPLTIRRRVKEVAADLPSRTDAVVPIRPGQALIAEYDRIRLDESIPLLARLTYLRQACASLSFLEGSSISFTQDNAKYDQTIQIVAEAFARSCKVVLFASFKETIDSIKADMVARFPRALVLTLDGRTAIPERQPMLDEFSRYSGPAILLLNPKAAGVGLNIQAANYVIHYTPEWNPATIDQASARSYRRGQTKPVFVYSLYYSDTVEQNMLERVASKRELAASGMSAAESMPSSSDLQQMMKVTPSGKRT